MCGPASQAMEPPQASLSLKSRSVFQTEHYSQASWTLRSGRLVRMTGACNNGLAHQDATHQEQLSEKVKVVPEPVKSADVHEPFLLDNPSKLAAAPSAAKPKEATTETEPDAEPVAHADRPVGEVNLDSHERDVEEKRHQGEVRSLTAQLMDAREQAERLKVNQEKQLADVTADRERCREAQDQSAKLQMKCRSHEQAILKIKKENAHKNAKLTSINNDLERQLRRLRKSPAMASPRSCLGNDRLATHMAGAECGPLRNCAAEQKAALKKKLLLKWHPDKQPSADHSTFATRVMQEMQNCAEWRD